MVAGDVVPLKGMVTQQIPTPERLTGPPYQLLEVGLLIEARHNH